VVELQLDMPRGEIPVHYAGHPGISRHQIRVRFARVVQKLEIVDRSDKQGAFFEHFQQRDTGTKLTLSFSSSSSSVDQT